MGIFNWTKEGKMIGAGIAGLTGLLTLLQLAPVAEPFVPVTHGYYRDAEAVSLKELNASLDKRRDDRDAFLANMKRDQDEKLASLKATQDEKLEELKVAADESIRKMAASLDDQAKQLNTVNEQGIENQLTTISGQLQSTRANVTDLSIKAESAKDNLPLRDMILRSKADAEAELADLEKAKDRVQCELNKARGFRVTAC